MINREIFDSIETLYSDLVGNASQELDDWRDFIEQFGDYYELSGRNVIEVTSRAVQSQSHIFGRLGFELEG